MMKGKDKTLGCNGSYTNNSSKMVDMTKVLMKQSNFTNKNNSLKEIPYIVQS